MVLAQVQMPLMVLPILTVMSKIDPNLADASRALGAGEWRTLWRVTLPLSLPGVIAGCILTYSACVTAFVTQTLIGGARLVYMPLHIYQQAIGANNWPFAAAISVIFMVAVLVVVGLLNLLGAKERNLCPRLDTPIDWEALSLRLVFGALTVVRDGVPDRRRASSC